VTPEAFDRLVDDLRAGSLDAEIPPHGTLGRNRQQIPVDKAVGALHPADVHEAPAWIQVSPA
jgi:NADH-quinone oxidoreductase subunit E